MQPGLWQRPIGDNESMIKMIGDVGQASGKDVWSISATACFSFGGTVFANPKPLTQALRDGWTALRFHHPSIATLAETTSLHYHVPGEQELARWLEDTFIVLHGPESTVDELLGTLPPKSYACCYFLEADQGNDVHQIILHLSHWRTDGIGVLHLLDAFLRLTVEHLQDRHFDAYTQLPWGQETSQLVPSVEHALELPHNPTETIHKATKMYLESLSYAKSALGIAPTSPSRNATRLPTMSFSAEQTTKLLSACSQRNIRFEAALHASVTAAACSLAAPSPTPTSHQQHHHHSSTLRHSLRPHLPAPYNGVAGAAGLYTAGYLVRVPTGGINIERAWLDNARYYESEYAKGATPELICSRRQYAVEMKAILTASTAVNDVGPPPSGLDMSWVPGAEDLVQTVYYGREEKEKEGRGPVLRVDGIGVSVDVLSRHVYVFSWMFREQIHFRLAFNRSLYDDTFAAKVLELVARELTCNLLKNGYKETSVVPDRKN